METQSQIQSQANKGPRPDMILGVRYEEYKPETYEGIEIDPLPAHEYDTVVSGRIFNSGNGFESDLEDAKKWLQENNLVAVCRSSFDHYQTDRKNCHPSAS